MARLRQNVTQYTRANDRRMVLRSIKEVKYLSCVPLDPIVDDSDGAEDFDEVEREVGTDRYVVNGVKFLDAGRRKHTKERKSDFLRTLDELVPKLCEMDGVTLRPERLYRGLVRRLDRSAGSADSYFRLNAMLGSPDLMVLPVKKVSGGKSLGGNTLPDPIELEVFVEGGSVHANVSIKNSYGLYRKTDVKKVDEGGAVVPKKKPWIVLGAYVEERVNFTNGESVRYLRVKPPQSLY